MSHLENIIFNKFRIFNSSYKMDLKPITFLTGPNSSGKSSVLKSILLLKSNYSSNMQVLDFTGEKHNLGTFKNTINKLSNNDDLISLGITAKLKGGSPFSLSLYKEPITTKRSVFYILKEDNEGVETTLTLNLFFRQVDRSGKLAKLELFEENNLKPFLVLNIGKDKDDSHTLELTPDTLIKNNYLNSLFLNFRITKDQKKIKTPIGKVALIKKYTIPSKFMLQEGAKESFYDEPILVFSHLYKQFLDENFKSKVNSDLHNYFLRQPLKQILQDFSSILDNTEYIEAVRANTRRLYTNDFQGTGFNELILDYNSREINSRSKKFIGKWLKEFEIADEIIFENIEGVASTIYLKDEEEKIALADLGYGITQFLPILLKIALEQPNEKKTKGESQIVKKLILVEEPETNLHPRLQSLLADFFIDALNTFEIRFIIETHSEYLIRRMQVLIADKVLDCDDSMIYYFNSKPNNNKDTVLKIDFLNNGSLNKTFGEGFFDEATNLKFELLKRKSKDEPNT